MRDLLRYPITPKEVIEFLESSVVIEKILADAMSVNEHMQVGNIDDYLAKVALEVVKTASIIIQNGDGFAAELLDKAFRSQDIPAKEIA